MTSAHYTPHGGKAENLALLSAHGVNVPKFVTIAAAETLSRDTIEKRIYELSFPLIVRSSGSIEDSDALSFAGQFDSVADLCTIDEVVETIASLHGRHPSEKVARCAAHYNIDPASIDLSFVIQEYKPSVAAGVLFTRSPADEHLALLEWSESEQGITSGTAGVQSVVINTQTKEITQEQHAKAWMRDLLDTGLSIEALYSAPQDIEWIFDGNQIWIVQSRPITAGRVDRDRVVRDEIMRLEKEFGPRAVHLAKSDFLDGLRQITPLSLSVLQLVYAPDGPWGQALRRYFMPVPRFDPRRYLVSVFGRPYVHTNLEHSILAVRGIRRYVGTLRAYAEMYYFYRKNLPLIRHTPSSADTVKHILRQTVENSAPFLFRIAMYQKTCTDYLYRRLHGHVSEDEWLSLVTPVVSGSAPSDLSYRALEELELSTPRWGEDPRIMERMEKQAEHVSFSSASTHTTDLRGKTIERIQSAWERQKVSLFFSLYDFFSRLREEARTAWLKDLYDLRRALLKTDRDARLYNTIWYADIETVLEHPHSLSFKQLRPAQRAHETMREIVLPEEIRDVQWSDLARKKPGQDPTRPSRASYTGIPLSHGYASGIAGTLEDLENGNIVDILVTENLDPSLTVFFGSIAGIVCERGGELSHAAIVAREYSIPILRMSNTVTSIKPGAQITLDTAARSARIG